MLTLAALLYALAAADVSLARTAGLHIARDAADIQQYLLQINSARFALSTMQASTDSAVCDQTSLPQDFDGSGIDPFLSRQLICEAAVGMVVFPDLTAASADLATAYAELQSLARDVVSTSPECLDFDPSSLDAAGINGTAVQHLVCISATNSAPTSTFTSAAASASSSTAFTLGNVTQFITSTLPVSDRKITASASISQPVAITVTLTSLPASSGLFNSRNGTAIVATQVDRNETTIPTTRTVAIISGKIGPLASDNDTFSIQTSSKLPTNNPPAPFESSFNPNGSQPTATPSTIAISSISNTASRSATSTETVTASEISSSTDGGTFSGRTSSKTPTSLLVPFSMSSMESLSRNGFPASATQTTFTASTLLSESTSSSAGSGDSATIVESTVVVLATVWVTVGPPASSAARVVAVVSSATVTDMVSLTSTVTTLNSVTVSSSLSTSSVSKAVSITATARMLEPALPSYSTEAASNSSSISTSTSTVSTATSTLETIAGSCTWQH